MAALETDVKDREAIHEVQDNSRYVARQPIMDLRARVYGYELLFRSGPDTIFRGDGDLATRTMLDNTVIYGLERLTGGLPAFVNCTSESLTSDLVHVLPPSMTVLEILEDVEPTTALVRACRRLKTSGYRLALDDFVWKPQLEPLIEIADYIKVDFSLCGEGERAELLKRLGGVATALLAEKVETQEEYRQACVEGFKLFQGHYFCRPVLMQNRKVPSNFLSHIEILQMLHDEDIDLRKATRLVKRDASLTYRLLRLVNSPICAIRQEVSSIQSALLAVGEETFRRVAVLAITSELAAHGPAELLRMAFIRGRFCEVAALGCGLDRTEQYLLGVLSLLPAMLQIPMEDLSPNLPLRAEIREALAGASCRERDPLAWLESFEHGDWEGCDAAVLRLDLPASQLLAWHSEAAGWADAALQAAR